MLYHTFCVNKTKSTLNNLPEILFLPMKPLLLCLILCFVVLLPNAEAQTLPEPRQSPIGLSRIIVDDCYVKVVYGRPNVRNRQIFGSLVPFGEVWRTGANEATELTTTCNLSIDGNTLPAGNYSIFSIPSEKEWVVIFNKQLGQWGSYTYNPDYDVFRITAPVHTTESTIEMFSIILENGTSNKAKMTFEWENSRVVLPVDM